MTTTNTRDSLAYVPRTSIVVDDAIGYRTYDSAENAEFIKSLTKSIAAQGLLTPLRGYVDPNGRYVLVQGFRRLRAIDTLSNADRAKWEYDSKIPFVVGPPMTQVEALLTSISSNEQTPASWLEQGLVSLRLEDEFKLTQKQIGERLGKSQSTISRYIWLARLPEKIRAALAEDLISTKMALRYFGDKEAVEKIEKILAGGDAPEALNRRKSGQSGVTANGGANKNADKEWNWRELFDAYLCAVQDFFENIFVEGEPVASPVLEEKVNAYYSAMQKLSRKYKQSLFPQYDDEDDD